MSGQGVRSIGVETCVRAGGQGSERGLRVLGVLVGSGLLVVRHVRTRPHSGWCGSGTPALGVRLRLCPRLGNG